MANPTASELKKILLARGFEIYRTGKEEVALADRVRDNLLMDAAVAAGTGRELRVRFAARAEASAFGAEGSDALFARARSLARPALQRGYRETEARVLPIRDPGDPARVLDTWYEVWFERPVRDLEELEQELRLALSLEKSAAGTL